MKERLEVRLTEDDKAAIRAKAKACGLSQSEYIRKRALGYAPRAAPNDALHDLTVGLCEIANRNLSKETEAVLLSLLEQIRKELFGSGKE